jgi:hypothetical protein
VNAEQVRARFPSARSEEIKGHPDDFFRLADVDGVFYDVWYADAYGVFLAVTIP